MSTSENIVTIRTTIEVIVIIALLCIAGVNFLMDYKKALLPAGLVLILASDFVSTISPEPKPKIGWTLGLGGFLAGLGFHYFL